MLRPAPRRTKIVCTLGPAVASRDGVRALIGAGMDVARLNFSHGSHDDHRRMMEVVREEAKRAGRVVPILQDLQGPKIRLGEVRDGGVLIHRGEPLVLTSAPVAEGDGRRVHVSYPALAEEVSEGNRILLDDGHLELVVTAINGVDVQTEVVVGGPLRSRKGVNLPKLKSARPSLTEKDVRDLAFGLAHDVDLIALSFVRSGSDVADLVGRVKESGKDIAVISKIEKPEAVEDFDAILDSSYGVMVARGDLGIEIPMQEVPIVQKQLIRKCLEASKPVITATQMLESMMENPRPTRAEATDVANAVLDGSDAVMLSGETAAGKYPVETVRVMDEIVRSVEANRRRLGGRQTVDAVHDNVAPVTEAVSYMAVQLAEQTHARAIGCLTHSGSTARAIASHRPDVPIYAFTDDEMALGRIALTWGVEPIPIPFQEHTDDGVRTVHRVLLESETYERGDRVVVTAGLPLPALGRTNMVHVTSLGEGWG
ncbi:pyruvate kinase [Rubrivirga litoralis]|uniref:Pyruvate kinase n=1 Tax=Rubrivirga litoralis TaxID=3075598 RepID=A0ABU3BVG2_9BACT|nr:pyruvate kinase [Rubrivirga sp. F394]MDT0633141.1 pyruvate kinase [Rubrivirga sp. F394]